MEGLLPRPEGVGVERSPSSTDVERERVLGGERWNLACSFCVSERMGATSLGGCSAPLSSSVTLTGSHAALARCRLAFLLLLLLSRLRVLHNLLLLLLCKPLLQRSVLVGNDGDGDGVRAIGTRGAGPLGRFEGARLDPRCGCSWCNPNWSLGGDDGRDGPTRRRRRASGGGREARARVGSVSGELAAVAPRQLVGVAQGDRSGGISHAWEEKTVGEELGEVGWVGGLGGGLVEGNVGDYLSLETGRPLLVVGETLRDRWICNRVYRSLGREAESASASSFAPRVRVGRLK